MVRFVGTRDLITLVNKIGIEPIFQDLVNELEIDFKRWPEFEKAPRVASHSADGVIELMPTSDGATYALKYVNGHPKNTLNGLRTVTAFGLLADVATGYPVFLAEMTILTALRTAATSALAAKYLARKDARVMALIGLGAQAEFQALAFKALLGINSLRVFDLDPATTKKFARNMVDSGMAIIFCSTAQDAVTGADIITTVTADKRNAAILTDNMVGAGVHINGVGGDCPGKTELHPDILQRSNIFTEFTPQTRVEGEIQQLGIDHPVTELWQVIGGHSHGRASDSQITLFDSVGFAIEDFTALRVIQRLALQEGLFQELDLIPGFGDPKDLYGLIRAAATNANKMSA